MAVRPIGPVGMAEYARRVVVRREAGLYAYQAALARAGLVPVAGADEAGRGACAGPLVAAAVILPEGRRGVIDELADSKLLTAAARDRVYDRVLDQAVAWAAVVASPAECDLLGMHRVNVQALRRSLRRLAVPPAYVLTDGFGVDGVGVPGLAVWKGDRVAACIAAASVVAKVTRDRIMTELHDVYPQYDFATHKGYCTAEHQQAMQQHGPSPVHRRKWVNVITAARVYAGEIPAPALPGPVGSIVGDPDADWPGGADWPGDGDWPVTMVPRLRRRLEEESDEH